MSSPANRCGYGDLRFDSVTSLPLSPQSQFSRTGTLGSIESNTSQSSRAGPWSPLGSRQDHLESNLTVDVVACDNCGIQFRGRYGRGNLARHIKQSHRAIKLEYPCHASECGKIFRRTDARLKHTRKHHPESYSTVKQGIPEVKEVGYVAVGSHFDQPSIPGSSIQTQHAVNQSSQPTQHATNSSTSAMARLHIIRMVLTALFSSLGDDYSRHIAQFLACWSEKVEQMRLNKSCEYTAYRLSLIDLRTVITNIALESRSQQFRAHARQQTGTSGSFNSAAGSSNNQNLDRGQISKGKGRAVRDKSLGKSSAAVRKLAQGVNLYCIGCPCHQRWLLQRSRGLDADKPCNGCSATFMSEIRTHLARRSHPDIRYFKHCPTCKQDFVDGQVYEYHLAICSHRTMTQGNIFAQWVPLCLALWPFDEVVPSPYIGDNNPLEPTLVDRYRTFPSAQSLSVPSFLGQPSQPLADIAIPSHPPRVPPSQGQSAAAMNTLLSDLVGPHHAANGIQPVPPSTGFTTAASGADSQPSNDFYSPLWQQYLDNFSDPGNTGLAPGQQLQSANGGHALPNATDYQHYQMIGWNRDPFQNQQFGQPALPLQSLESSFNGIHNENLPYGSLPQMDMPLAPYYHNPRPNPYAPPLYRDSSNVQPLTSFQHQLEGARTMSTQTSSQGWDLASSPYVGSTLTSPTSLMEAYDQALLSPLGMQRSTSTRSAGVPEIPRLRRARPSFRSLGEGRIINSYAGESASAASGYPRQGFFDDPQVVPDVDGQNDAGAFSLFWGPQAQDDPSSEYPSRQL